jgi:hypothetical protein
VRPAVFGFARRKRRFVAENPIANLLRFVPSNFYFARISVKGKLIRKGTKADPLRRSR